MHEREREIVAIQNYAGVADLIGAAVRSDEQGWARGQAITAGLLLRISGIMKSVLHLIRIEGNDEAIMALTRLIFETSANVRYIVAFGSDELHDRFVNSGLKADVELFDDINKRITDRGEGEMIIERNMKESVMRYVANSEATMDEIRASARHWGPDYRSRLAAMGEEETYLYIQSMESSAIHGDWSSLLRFHLSKSERGYGPEEYSVEIHKALGTPAIYACNATLSYLRKYDPDRMFTIQSLEGYIEALHKAIREPGDFEPSPQSSD